MNIRAVMTSEDPMASYGVEHGLKQDICSMFVLSYFVIGQETSQLVTLRIALSSRDRFQILQISEKFPKDSSRVDCRSTIVSHSSKQTFIVNRLPTIHRQMYTCKPTEPRVTSWHGVLGHRLTQSQGHGWFMVCVSPFFQNSTASLSFPLYQAVYKTKSRHNVPIHPAKH